ncbi:unnamed protein product [Moneuplotes crassus]|uniref:Uncharacterized protein n=1 Tax=Euplotes crassus TaxID=5936 RepID=A0AAD1UFD3_EUPCR|nr:unnamed protein product [Moneuplotes crassus]
MRANQEIHKKVAWYFQWLKTKRKNTGLISKEESPFKNANLTNLKFPIKFNDFESAVFENKTKENGTSFSNYTSKYIRKLGSPRKKKIILPLKKKMRYTHHTTKGDSESLRTENLLSSTLERPNKNSSLFTSGKRINKSEKKYMSNTAKFWNLKMWNKANKHNKTFTKYYNSTENKHRSSISGKIKRKNAKPSKIKISFFDLKGKDMSVTTKKSKRNDGNLNKSSTLFHARNFSLNTPNAGTTKLMNSTEKHQEAFIGLKNKPDMMITGIEGKGILSHSSAEFSPEVQRFGILSKTPNLQSSKTTYARKNFSHIDVDTKKERFPQLDEFLRMQYMFSQSRKRAEEDGMDDSQRQELAQIYDLRAEHKKININLKNKLREIQPIKVEKNVSVQSSSAFKRKTIVDIRCQSREAASQASRGLSRESESISKDYCSNSDQVSPSYPEFKPKESKFRVTVKIKKNNE